MLSQEQFILEGEACYVNEQGCVQCGGIYTGVATFFNLLLQLTNQKHENTQKSHVEYIIKSDQSQMRDGKIASNGKMLLTAKCHL